MTDAVRPPLTDTGAGARPLRRHYHPVSIAFHWTIAALVLLQLLWGWRMSRLDPGHDKLDAYAAHVVIGAALLCLTVMRAFWRAWEGAALPALDDPPTLTPFQKLASEALYIGTYMVLVALPVTGWLMLSADGQRADIPLFSGLSVPRLPAIADLDYAGRARWEDAMQAAHFWLVMALLAMLAGHVGAALKHHFVDRDWVLARMIPALSRRRRTAHGIADRSRDRA